VSRVEGSRSPYVEIFDDVVRSVMRAQSEVLLRGPFQKLEEFPHQAINRHFVWLTLEYRLGTNRHFFDSIQGNSPIRLRPLRAPRRLPANIRRKLQNRLELDENELDEAGVPLVQSLPTRISCLIAQSFLEIQRGNFTGLDEESDELQRADKRDHIQIKSPLAIAFDFFTIPEMPGSRSYVLLTLRNHLFQSFQRYPVHFAELPEDVAFTPSDVEEALSHIQTSFRPRYYSRGYDNLPVKGLTKIGTLIRQYLLTRGVFWMRFLVHNDECIEFLKRGDPFQSELADGKPIYELSRSDYLDHLPELGELVNELWGIPIPIRGGDTLFRGGLKFSSRGGLVMGIHGGPGVGKTSLSLALGAVLSPFGIRTLFMTGEETAKDLENKIEALLPDDLRRRLSFFSPNKQKWLLIQPFSLETKQDVAHSLERALRKLGDALEEANAPLRSEGTSIPCCAVVVLDGLHDLLVASTSERSDSHDLIRRLREFVTTCRELQALVILTTGEDWEGDKALDYIVDVAVRLSHHGIEEYGKKPDRRIRLTKARHQLCAVGTHGIQIAGAKGVRLSPQINYQLDKRAIWKTRLPEGNFAKRIFQKALSKSDYDWLTSTSQFNRRPMAQTPDQFAPDMVRLPRGSNIYLHGEGSGGKAPLALKIAISPAFKGEERVLEPEKILVVSFLYPTEYYVGIMRRLLRLRRFEYNIGFNDARPDLNVIQLYPGHYQPDHLFNRIEWELDAAELHGRPYTSVVIDGIHNVFLQFPEIERYSLFWPQLYAALRTRSLTIISTHSTIVLQGTEARVIHLDDRRSEPLRHALVQKTDFRFEIDRVDPLELAKFVVFAKDRLANIFRVRTLSAIDQSIPSRDIYWSREDLVLLDFQPRQPSLFPDLSSS
jgi:KaiC/GvpD/RAD55 family RecA-like ATPase